MFLSAVLQALQWVKFTFDKCCSPSYIILKGKYESNAKGVILFDYFSIFLCLLL